MNVCHTSLSFKYGTLSPKQLFAEARRCVVRKLVLAEINNTASYIEMLRICEKSRRVNGSLDRYGNEGYDLEIAVAVEVHKSNDFLYLLIAQNNNGFESINRFLSQHSREKKPFPRRVPELADVFVVYPYPTMDEVPL